MAGGAATGQIVLKVRIEHEPNADDLELKTRGAEVGDGMAA